MAFADGDGGGAGVGGDDAAGCPRVFMYAIICHLCCSGRLDQDGMPLSMSPLVMYQKSSPSLADCVERSVKPGTLPVPSAFDPWQAAHFANRLWPARTAAACPARGFFIWLALAGALWNDAPCCANDEDNKNAATPTSSSESKRVRALSFKVLLRSFKADPKCSSVQSIPMNPSSCASNFYTSSFHKGCESGAFGRVDNHLCLAAMLDRGWMVR